MDKLIDDKQGDTPFDIGGLMSKLKFMQVEDLPLVLTPMDIAAVLGISRNTAYEIIHRKGFPVVKIGKQYRVQREHLFQWLGNQAAAEKRMEDYIR